LAGFLQKAQGIAIIGPKTLVLRFPPGYNHEYEHCQDPARVTRIEQAVQKITGQVWNLRIEPVGKEAAASHVPAGDTDKSSSRHRRQRTEAMQEPLVKRALEQLGAQIVQVDDDFGAAPAGSAEAPEVEET
jgi:hypothetical protein